MSQSLDRAYDAHAVQEEVARRWEAANAFHAEPDRGGAEGLARDPYAIVIPPPNVTAALHMGHALNNTLQDILIRWRRMAGDNAVWVPGTDHAGIATQTVVDKRLKAEGQPALADYKKMEAEGEGGRERFIGKVQAWKDEYERRITEQLMAMGCSCDYQRQRFTMDPVCAAAVREAFFRLFRDGLIYRGKRLVNWDPATQTALADDEVEMREVDSSFWYMKYPLERAAGGSEADIEYVTVATTRPETMLGDTAVAVNPNDPERKHLIGRRVRLPIVNRVIPIIGDEHVVMPDPDSDDAMARNASGFLKVTPAHDPNDYAIGQRHGLELINVMAPDATISREHGWPAGEWEESGTEESGTGVPPVTMVDPFAHELLGMAREDARAAIVEWFEREGLMAEIRPYRHAVGHSYRSHVPVEPYLSDQWYVQVTDDRLAGAALRAMEEGQRSASEGCAWKDNNSFAQSNQAQGLEPLGFEGEGELRFHPARYAKTYQAWHENIRDWCISRQLWWGHRIPVWSYRLEKLEARDVQHGEGKYGPFHEWQTKMSERDEAAVGLCDQLEDEVHDHVDMSDWRPWSQMPERDGPLDLIIHVCLRHEDPEIIRRLETAGFTRDPDVLDTWFSSALWPISTLGWPDPEAFPEQFSEGSAALERWNPSSTLCTAREIITLWVSRMVMFNTYFRGCLPFRDVFVHAMIQDGEGQKMSKSLGNGVDPLDIIHSHGADAMRLTLAGMATQTQDVGMPVQTVDPHTGEAFDPKQVRTPAGYTVAAPIQASPSDPSKKMVTSYGMASGEARPTDDMPLARNTSTKFDYGRNFANKLWNAGRFVLANLETETPPEAQGLEPLGLADRWILSRLAATHRRVNVALESYRFNEYAQQLYDFVWRDFCDWYLEAIKPVARADSAEGAATRRVLAGVFDAILRMLHPATPFATEKLWWALNEAAPERGLAGVELPHSELCIDAAWPRIDAEALHDDTAEDHFELVRDVVTAIRNVRNQYGVPPRQTVTVRIQAGGESAETLDAATELVETLAGCTLAMVGGAAPAEGAATAVVGEVEVYVEGLIDPEAERERLTGRLGELEKSRAALGKRLDNPGYVEKAPAHLVQQTRDNLAETEREIETIERKIERLET